MRRFLHAGNLIFAAAFAAAYLLVWWLVQAESSPFYAFFLDHVEIGNILTRLSLPAVLAGILVSGNVHAPSEIGTFVAMFVQWFLVGWLVSIPALRFLTPSSGAR